MGDCFRAYLSAIKPIKTNIKEIRFKTNKTCKTKLNISRTQIYQIMHQCKLFTLQLSRSRTPSKLNTPFLSKMDINVSIISQVLKIPGDSSIITKYEHLNRRGHGLDTYTKDKFPCSRETKNEYPDLTYIYFRVILIHSTIFFLAMFCPQDNCQLIFDQISLTISSTNFIRPNSHIR